MLVVIMLNVTYKPFMLSVVILSVVAPKLALKMRPFQEQPSMAEKEIKNF
jgi:hypothetical protein